MSKKRKSINLHLLEGNKNRLTKAEIKKRQAHEERMKGNTDNIKPPPRLSKAQKERFGDISDQLLELEIFSNLDVDTLSLYIETYDNYIRTIRSAKRMTNKEMDEDFDEYAKRMRTATQLAGVCRQLASDLGLTITSRMKLVIPEKEEKEVSDFDKKFGNV